MSLLMPRDVNDASRVRVQPNSTQTREPLAELDSTRKLASSKF